MTERKALRVLREKDKYNLSINKKIAANARKTLPYEHILDWWTNASQKFNNQSFWNELTNDLSKTKKS